MTLSDVDRKDLELAEARIRREVTAEIRTELDKLREESRARFVTAVEFGPIKKFVYASLTALVGAVIAAMIGLLKGGGK